MYLKKLTHVSVTTASFLFLERFQFERGNLYQFFSRFSHNREKPRERNKRIREIFIDLVETNRHEDTTTPSRPTVRLRACAGDSIFARFARTKRVRSGNSRRIHNTCAYRVYRVSLRSEVYITIIQNVDETRKAFRYLFNRNCSDWPGDELIPSPRTEIIPVKRVGSKQRYYTQRLLTRTETKHQY